jgi:hypothetical protein
VHEIFNPTTFVETPFGMHLEPIWSYIEYAPAAKRGIEKFAKDGSLAHDELSELKDRGIIVAKDRQLSSACDI